MFMAGPFPLEGEAAGATVAPAGAGAGDRWSVHVRGSVQFDPDVLDPLVHDAEPGGSVVAEHVERRAHTRLTVDTPEQEGIALPECLAAGAIRFQLPEGETVRLVGRPPFGECLVQTCLGILADVPG